MDLLALRQLKLILLMTDKKDSTSSIMSRLYLLVSFLGCFAVVLIAKLIYIQFYFDSDGVEFSSNQIIKNVVLEPSRGNIYASDGNILATSVPRYELHWDAIVPSKLYFDLNKNALADSISSFTGTDFLKVIQGLEKARIQKSDESRSVRRLIACIHHYALSIFCKCGCWSSYFAPPSSPQSDFELSVETTCNVR